MSTIPVLLENIVPQSKSLAQLKTLIGFLRKNKSNGIPQLITALEQDAKQRKNLSVYVQAILARYTAKELLTDSGINDSSSFASAIANSIKHTLLPVVPQQHSFAYLLHCLFPEKYDAEWVNSISDDDWLKLLELIFTEEHNRLSVTLSHDEISEALEILSYRVASSALNTSFNHRYASEVEHYQALTEQHKFVEMLREEYEKTGLVGPASANMLITQLNECLTALHELKRTAIHSGTSLQATFTIHRMQQQLMRMRLLAQMISGQANSLLHAVVLFKQLLQNEKDKNSLLKLFSENSYLLAYRIAEHESSTGEHYIATNEKEYYDFFKAASKGGIIAALMTFVKIILHHLHFAPFWEAFCYSLNYATGFVSIQISHAILATKQPAMTASTIAAALDKKSTDKPSIPDLALLIGSVSRSQFISFAGNLLLVFPVSFLIAAVYYLTMGHELVNEQEATKMLHDVHPWENPTWVYASITGVFLFISGIISGYYDNKVIYSSIPHRIKQHVVLRRFLSQRQLIRFAQYVEYNLGSLIGNICLGFFLGTAAFLGFIFGLPFDIRHITISSGNYAIAVFTLMTHPDWRLLAEAFIGVMGIGFFNFLVSFGLAITVAAKSRRVGKKEFKELLIWVKKYIRRYPKDFVVPPKTDRKPQDIDITIA